MSELRSDVLAGQRALVLGVANQHSIAYGCARVLRRLGAEVALTYGNEKSRAYVEPLAKELDAPILECCDVSKPGQLEAVFDRVRETWGGLDIALHSIAFAPKDDLHGRVVDSSSEGFGVAMDISCHSFIRMARLAEPLMPNGGTLLAMSYHGANKVVPNYNLMGPVKAALESVVRYLAYELGSKHIRVHAVSPGPLKTRAASGLKDFDVLLAEASNRSPIGELIDIDDVGLTTAFLATPFARRLTGTVTYVDGGLSIMA
jgi:enoyl-[acyl-carrier protein] reductase I